MAAPRLLASYERERRPVGLRNCDAARRHSEKRAAIAAVYREAGDLTAPAADAARGAAGLRIGAIGNAENESFGIELGYAYADSEVICADPGADIPNDPLHYIPTTAPGARMPSVLLAGGTPIFDRLGLWFTLVCFGAPPSEALVAAAARRGVPLDVLRIDDPDTVRVYGRGLLSDPAGSAYRLARSGMRGRARGRCDRVARGGVWRLGLMALMTAACSASAARRRRRPPC